MFGFFKKKPDAASLERQAESERHAARQLKALDVALKLGHTDQRNLRELLIMTTSTITYEAVSAYFVKNYNDESLLKSLIAIALEGEDAGDAPWAAANTLSEFPASMLAGHESALVVLSQEPWSYLHTPGLKALTKVRAIAAQQGVQADVHEKP